ncbi:FkbM family methyltransferase [Candidatus Micrarchaeota archaeon]|nr:FkbM family methyltransferase [Candidatus Micrarchaeota archaeon]MBU1939413.1 FkbM family methyltransferase [Candidatus Micrarchaeota archaeon]
MNIILRALLKLRNSLFGTGLGKIPGLAWLSEKTYKTLAPEKLTLIVHHGVKIFVNPREEGLGASLFGIGTFEEYETALFESLLKPGMTVADIGANLGYYSLLASGRVGRKGRVYSFEPEPKNRGILLKNIKENNFTNIIPINMALSNRKGKLKLYTDKSNEGRNSLSETNVIDKKGFVNVQATTLDSYFLENAGSLKVDFIKIDVEGAEGLVFEGAEKILKKNNLKILMEFCPYFLGNLGTDPLQMLEKMRGFGFKLKYIDAENKKLTLMPAGKIIEICGGMLEGKGAVNLLLEK